MSSKKCSTSGCGQWAFDHGLCKHHIAQSQSSSPTPNGPVKGSSSSPSPSSILGSNSLAPSSGSSSSSSSIHPSNSSNSATVPNKVDHPPDPTKSSLAGQHLWCPDCRKACPKSLAGRCSCGHYISKHQKERPSTVYVPSSPTPTPTPSFNKDTLRKKPVPTPTSSNSPSVPASPSNITSSSGGSFPPAPLTPSSSDRVKNLKQTGTACAAGLSSPTPTPAGLGLDVAIPMLTFSSGSNSDELKLTSEAKARLTQIAGPFKVVSIIGRSRFGKSSLLNRLVLINNPAKSSNSNSTGTFGVGHNVAGHTVGAWMYIDWPKNTTTAVGTAGNVPIVYIDCEGMGDLLNTRSVKQARQISSTILLLSSLCILNLKGTLDTTSLEQFAFLHKISECIAPKRRKPHDSKQGSNSNSNSSGSGSHSPALLLAVRDFQYKYGSGSSSDSVSVNARARDRIRDETSYMEEALAIEASTDDYDDPTKMVRQTIRNNFPKRYCICFPSPSKTIDIDSDSEKEHYGADHKLDSSEYTTKVNQLNAIVRSLPAFPKAMNMNAAASSSSSSRVGTRGEKTHPIAIANSNSNSHMTAGEYCSMVEEIARATTLNNSIPFVVDAWKVVCLTQCAAIQDRVLPTFQQLTKSNINDRDYPMDEKVLSSHLHVACEKSLAPLIALVERGYDEQVVNEAVTKTRVRIMESYFGYHQRNEKATTEKCRLVCETLTRPDYLRAVLANSKSASESPASHLPAPAPGQRRSTSTSTSSISTSAEEDTIQQITKQYEKQVCGVSSVITQHQQILLGRVSVFVSQLKLERSNDHEEEKKKYDALCASLHAQSESTKLQLNTLKEKQAAAALAHQAQIEQLQSHLVTQQKEVEDARQAEAAKYQSLLRAQVEDKERELRNKLYEAQSRIQSLESERYQLQSRVNSADSRYSSLQSSTDSTISNLRSENKQLQSDVLSLKSRVDKLKDFGSTNGGYSSGGFGSARGGLSGAIGMCGFCGSLRSPFSPCPGCRM